MKQNLYLASLGLLLCSCSEPGDVVTGHARIITKSSPVVAAAPALPQPAPLAEEAVPEPQTIISQNQPEVVEPLPPISSEIKEEKPTIITKPAPAPQPVVAEPTPAPEPVATAPEPEPTVLSQNQPKVSEPPPVLEEKPVIVQKEELKKAKPAPVSKAESEVTIVKAQEEEEITTDPTVIVGQKQPVTSTPVKPALVTKPAPTPTPAPAAAPRVIRPNASSVVSQQQPAVSAPASSVNWNTPQVKPKALRTYPIMPGQNRGLRRRGAF